MEDDNQVFTHKSVSKGNLFATIYKQDLDYLSKCILDYPDSETGGDLFGFWNNRGLPVIVYVSGPGENCYRDSGFFRQDLDFLIGTGNHLFENYGLQHIGSWHSHHKLSLAVPSLHDSNTMVNAIKNSNLERFFMVLGNITKQGATTVNGFLYDSKTLANYSETDWKVLHANNVLSKAIKSRLAKELCYEPKTKRSRLQDIRLVPTVENKILPLNFEPDSWLASPKGKQELKAVFDWFQARFQDAQMLLHENENLELRADTISVIFPREFPNRFPKIEIGGDPLLWEDGKFDYETEADIVQFIECKLEKVKTLNN